MIESTEELQSRLHVAIAPGFRDRLLDKGLARGLIWRDGVLPEGSPPFSVSLTEDLLDYGFTVLAMALRLRSKDRNNPMLDRAFLVAGEAIEAAVHRGEPQSDLNFNRVSAAVAFHLARYAAQAFSIMPTAADGENLAPTERVLIQLLLRALDEMHIQVAAWLLTDEHHDERIFQRLCGDFDFDETDAFHEVLTTSFMRGLALFDHAIKTGDSKSANKAKSKLFATAEAAKIFHEVNHWWTASLAAHLIDELWELSLHQQLPYLGSEEVGHENWGSLRRDYIQRLRARKRAAIELWPSQLEAATRALNLVDDLVVALPTSAGKTRIAEMCILRALSSDYRVVYVTPLRALSAQIERDLAETFLPLGYSVSSLYGSAGIESGDERTLREGKIVVSTPEKLDFALRNDPGIIDDVGLIVLDEGHMLGPNEREVRYEALVQRLLRRSDAESRRIVCLSALFPPPNELSDLVAWIRQDNPGEPIYSIWRPTRQRFGVLHWQSDAARLDVKVEDENPFVPRFVVSKEPPIDSKRRKRFPSDKNELTLAAAWRFVEQNQEVLIYCSLRQSVETLGNLILKCVNHGVLRPLRQMTKRIQDAIATGTEWLGADHPAVKCLYIGVVLHHGGLPRPFLNDIEQLLRVGDCPLIIASPTLAQGLNLSASVLLVPSIWRNKKIIPATELANVSGRAGRAFVDVEGLVLHIVWEDNIKKKRRALYNWNELVAKARASRVKSGLLLLSINIFNRIASVANVSIGEVVDYVTGHSNAWDFTDAAANILNISADDWERDLASFDAAILGLLNVDAHEENLDTELNEMLQGSLFSRQLAKLEANVQTILRGLVLARARLIWAKTNNFQRKGYHFAGIGLRTGQFLDENINNLTDFLINAEAAVVSGDANLAANSVIEFATLVFKIIPFRAPGNMPNTWSLALRAWLRGRPSSEVIWIGGEDGVDLLQDTLTYRLPWAMEAVRVHASALGIEGVDQIQGFAAMAVETGSCTRSVITLIRSELNSREAAITAVGSTGASFVDQAGMKTWLNSKEIETLSELNGWPTAQSRHAWLQFLEAEKKGDRRKWKREIQKVKVAWFSKEAPTPGIRVIVEPDAIFDKGIVLTPDFIKLGVLKSVLRRPRREIVDAIVSDLPGIISVEFFGPKL